MQQLPGVAEAKVSFATEWLNVTCNAQQVKEGITRNRITALGCTVEPIPNWIPPDQPPSSKTLQAHVMVIAVGLGAKPRAYLALVHMATNSPSRCQISSLQTPDSFNVKSATVVLGQLVQFPVDLV